MVHTSESATMSSRCELLRSYTSGQLSWWGHAAAHRMPEHREKCPVRTSSSSLRISSRSWSLARLTGLSELAGRMPSLLYPPLPLLSIRLPSATARSPPQSPSAGLLAGPERSTAAGLCQPRVCASEHPLRAWRRTGPVLEGGRAGQDGHWSLLPVHTMQRRPATSEGVFGRACAGSCLAQTIAKVVVLQQMHCFSSALVCAYCGTVEVLMSYAPLLR